jgi:glyoxylase-like metal-dependent hydrolase (beta-lactamase superfamily II)
MTHDRLRSVLVALVLCVVCRIEVPALAQVSTNVDALSAAGVVRVRTGVVSMFLIANERAAILIDAGLDPKGEAILKALAESHLGPDDVNAVFITHAHADHVSASALFPKARFYAFTAPSELAEVIDPSRLTRLTDGETTTVEGSRSMESRLPARAGRPPLGSWRNHTVQAAQAQAQVEESPLPTLLPVHVPSHRPHTCGYLAATSLAFGWLPAGPKTSGFCARWRCVTAPAPLPLRRLYSPQQPSVDMLPS